MRGSLVQITRSLSFKRRVLRRASTTSTGERPANGFPSVAVVGGAGFDLTCMGGFMDGGGSLREAMMASFDR